MLLDGGQCCDDSIDEMDFCDLDIHEPSPPPRPASTTLEQTAFNTPEQSLEVRCVLFSHLRILHGDCRHALWRWQITNTNLYICDLFIDLYIFYFKPPQTDWDETAWADIELNSNICAQLDASLPLVYRPSKRTTTNPQRKPNHATRLLFAPPKRTERCTTPVISPPPIYKRHNKR